jgi:hypothetical protein
MTNLKFDEVVEGEDILSAFGAESKQAEVSKPAEVSLAAAFGAKTAEKPNVNVEVPVAAEKTVTISVDQFSKLMNMVKRLTEEVASLKAGKPVTKVTQSSNATEAKPKRTREQYLTEMKEKNKAKAAERLVKCVTESGKSETEVKAAFKVAHTYANADQTQYKARFDEKLVELIGVRKYAA